MARTSRQMGRSVRRMRAGDSTTVGVCRAPDGHAAPVRLARSRRPVRTAAATIVARPMLAHARVTAASFREHHPDVPFFTLLADAGEPGAQEPFTPIAFDELA